MDMKSPETQQIADEKLDSVAGGARDNFCLETNAREAAEFGGDGEGEDELPSIIICPRCLHTLIHCTCRDN